MYWLTRLVLQSPVSVSKVRLVVSSLDVVQVPQVVFIIIVQGLLDPSHVGFHLEQVNFI